MPQRSRAQGWDAAVARYRPKLAEKKANVSVGEFIEEVKTKADLEARTIDGYCKAFRTIVASIFEIDGGKEKFDHRKGGHEKWLARVHGIKLSALTPARIQEWSWKRFLTRSYRLKFQRNFFEHRIWNSENFSAYCQYVRLNPVRAGLVIRPEDWTWVYPRLIGPSDV